MNICFYNMNHIGDNYFMSLFLNIICQQNKSVNFLYYTINSDIFFENIPNLHRLGKIEDNYSNKLTNGAPPENLLDNSVLSFLLNNKMQLVDIKLLNFMECNIIFINTWCIPLNHGEWDIPSAIKGYNNVITKLNNNYGFMINFNIDNYSELLNNNYSIKNNYGLVSKNFENLEETIIIFNFHPRSLPFNIGDVNNLIKNLSINNNIILTSYNNLFENHKNIKFIDKDYNINPVPSCKNLLEIWDIAIKCKKIIILPTGGSWTFLHKLKYIKNDQLYMFNGGTGSHYCTILNSLVNCLLGEKKDLLNLFN